MDFDLSCPTVTSVACNRLGRRVTPSDLILHDALRHRLHLELCQLAQGPEIDVLTWLDRVELVMACTPLRQELLARANGHHWHAAVPGPDVVVQVGHAMVRLGDRVMVHNLHGTLTALVNDNFVDAPHDQYYPHALLAARHAVVVTDHTTGTPPHPCVVRHAQQTCCQHQHLAFGLPLHVVTRKVRISRFFKVFLRGRTSVTWTATNLRKLARQLQLSDNFVKLATRYMQCVKGVYHPTPKLFKINF